VTINVRLPHISYERFDKKEFYDPDGNFLDIQYTLHGVKVEPMTGLLEFTNGQAPVTSIEIDASKLTQCLNRNIGQKAISPAN
jgi:hypothetical protein